MCLGVVEVEGKARELRNRVDVMVEEVSKLMKELDELLEQMIAVGEVAYICRVVESARGMLFRSWVWLKGARNVLADVVNMLEKRGGSGG